MIRTLPINTENLFLRRFIISDFRNAYDEWMSDDDVTEFLTWNAHESPEESARIIAGWVRAYNTGTMDWCITLKPDLEPIGSITAVQDFPQKGYCELGYCIGKDHWGRGYMTEAVKAVTNYIFINTDYQWVQARYDSENFGSGKCLEKCGYRLAAVIDIPSKKRRGELRRNNIMRAYRKDIKI